MKNIKGEILPQPYLDLAMMRREQQPEFAKIWANYFNETQRLRYAFDWGDTPEKNDWWEGVYFDNTPDIPASSLAELEAWRKEKEMPAEPVTDNHTKTFKVGDKARIIGNTLGHQFKIGEIVILDQINTSGMSCRCYDLDKKDWWNVAVSDMELVEPDFKGMYEDLARRYKDLQWTFSELREQKIELEKRAENAPDTTDWKAKYEAADEIHKTIIDTLVFERDELQAKHEALEKEANELTAALKELGAKYDELKYGDPTRNWIAECVPFQKCPVCDGYGEVRPIWNKDAQQPTYVKCSVCEGNKVILMYNAEAWAAEGKKRGHIV